ncbi:MAG: EscU/YscU/HrcU family type III secretion system export apparatus switch protein [Spirochaetes bacterium]|nr:EscU/YscU/HrcU family type III secretion system export apparatus switch protein [Spirochaetota bacterium]
MISEKKGVAIEYSGDMPRIVAAARGALLKRLLEIAEHHNITVYRDRDLTEVLFQLPVGSEIPDSLFAAVAKVLAYCYRINDEFKRKILALESDNV